MAKSRHYVTRFGAQDAKTQPAELKRKARSLAYQHQEAVKQGRADKVYVFGLQANVIEDEIEARILRGEIRRKSPSRRTSAQPTPLMDAIEEYPPKPYRACVPSPQTVVLTRIVPQQLQAEASSESVAPYAPSPDGTRFVIGMIARLRSRAQQRGAST